MEKRKQISKSKAGETYREASEMIKAMQEQTQQQITGVQNEAFGKLLNQYIEAIKTSYGKVENANVRGRFLENLAMQIEAAETVLGNSSGNIIYVDFANNLNEVICQAINYKSQTLKTDEKLAQWMERSRPTANRMKKLAREYALKNSDLLRGQKTK